MKLTAVAVTALPTNRRLVATPNRGQDLDRNNFQKGVREMSLRLHNPNFTTLRFRGAVAVAAILLVATGLIAQTTVGTGSIVGTVMDPSGAILSDAQVTIVDTATGETINVKTNSSGAYNSGALSPGNYKVTVIQKGFSSVVTTTIVRVGNTSTVNARMQLGTETTTI